MQNRIKRVMCFLLVLIFAAAAAAGCGTTTQSGNGTTAATTTAAASSQESVTVAEQAPVQLKVMSWGVGEEDVFKNISDAFSKKYPNLSFTFEAKPFDQYFVVIDTQIQAGEAPDLFAGLGTASTSLSKWARQGAVEALDGIVDVSGFLPWLVKDFMVDGKLYQTPSLVGDMYGVLYNKDLFDKFGLSVPQSQADLINICDTFVKNDITPFMLAGKSINQDQLINIVGAYAPEWNNGFPWHKRHYSDPEFVNAVKLMQDWADKGYFGKDFKSLDGPAALSLYSQGKIAMNLGATYTVTGLKSAVPNTSLFFLKTPDGKNACIQTPSQQNGYCLNKATKHRDEAVTLLNFLMTPEATQELVDKFGFAPLSQEASKGLTVNDPITKMFSEGDNPVPCYLDQISPIAAEGFDVWNIVGTDTTKLFYKQATPEDLAKDFDQMTNWALVK